MKSETLTERQRLFVEHYIALGNATRAAKAAGYSEKSAHVNGPRLLANARVGEAIEEARAEQIERVQIDADMVLSGLLKEARREGRDASHSARVASWTALGKHLKMFTDKVEGSGPDGGPVVIERLIIDPKASDTDR